MLTMVDNSATHNFMREEAAKKFRLNFVTTQARLKEVNSKPDQVIGVEEVLEVKICQWLGEVEFMIMQKDDYEAILGIEFMKKL